ncbi:MAG: response regulator [Armatimonadetes bacterium]|nr:response regulator [Armatimonadota bacterium]
MSQLTVVATEPVPGAASKLLDSLADSGPLEVRGFAADGMEAARMAVMLRPDVLLLHAAMPGMSGLQVAQIVSQAAPEVACVVLADKQDEKLLRLAMMSGARAVVSPDMSSHSIYEQILQAAAGKRVRETVEYARATDPDQSPVCVGVAGVVGGSGRTTIAVNLAVLLAQRAPKDSILVEMVPQAGRAAFLLNLKPRSGLADLLEAGEDWPDYALEACLTEHSSGLRLLAGCSGAGCGLLDRISLPFTAALVSHIRRRYRFAVFHMPSALWSAGAYLLRRCDKVLVVTTGTDMLCLHDTASYVAALTELGVPRASITIVMNKVSRGDKVTRTAMAEACGISDVVEIPADPKTSNEAMGVMMPAVVYAANSPLSRGLRSLAERLITQRVAVAA